MKLKTKNKNINKTKARFFIVVFFVLVQINFTHTALCRAIEAQEVIDLTNRSRIEAGFDPLIVNDKLTQAATAKVNDMFQNQYFDHNSPQGLTPWDFIKSAGYEYKFAGENLAIDFITAHSAHKALMESSSHRENILNVKYTEIGVAVFEGKFKNGSSIIIVEEFGSLFIKEKVSVVIAKELDIEIIEKVDEINNELIKTNIKEKNIKINIRQRPEEELDTEEDNLDSISENKLLTEIDLNGVCEAENTIYTALGIIPKNNTSFVFNMKNNYYSNSKIQTKDNSVGLKNIIFINKALAGDTCSEDQRSPNRANTKMIENDLYIKLVFFYIIDLLRNYFLLQFSDSGQIFYKYSQLSLG